MTRSQEFIKAYSNKLEAAADFYNFDTSFMKRNSFKTAKYKFMLILPCPAAAKAVSSTAAVLNDYFHHYHPDWFIDFAWLPSERDIKHYDTNRLPYAIGAITHLDPSHFDAIGFSFSILHELLTVPVMINSLSRCDKPIPLTWTERKDLKCDEVPLVLSGGIASPHADICFGELGDGRISYVDAILLGTEEPLGELIIKHMEARKQGLSVQELYDQCFSIPSFYQPQAYEVKFEDNRIVSNKKINPKAQDQVIPHYPKEFTPKRLYTARTITPASGENAGVLQWMHSEGAAAAGQRVLTSKGSIPIEHTPLIATDNKTKALSDKTGNIINFYSLGEKPTLVFTTKSGRTLEVTPDHPIHQWDPFEGESFVEAEKLKVGDFLTSPIIKDESSLLTPLEAEFLGRMVGSGNYLAEEKSLTFKSSDFHKVSDLLNSLEIKISHFKTSGKSTTFFFEKNLDFDLKYGFFSERIFSYKYLPESVNVLGYSSSLAFLKGLHDSSGTCQGNIVTYRVESKEILNGIISIAARCGIYGTHYQMHPKRNLTKPFIFTVSADCFSLLKDFNCFDELQVPKHEPRSYYLPHNKEQLKKYFRENFDSSFQKRYKSQVFYKKLTASLAKTLNLPVPKELYYFDEIVSIKQSKAECHDLTVCDTLRYVCNGFLIHNCAGKGNCNFKVAEGTLLMTDRGLEKIEDLVGINDRKVQGVNMENYLQIEEQSPAKKIIVRTKTGRKLESDSNHKWLILKDTSLKEVTTTQLKKGDIVFKKLGHNYTEPDFTIEDLEKAKLLGFLQGEEWLNASYSNNSVLLTSEEMKVYEPLLRKYCSVDTTSKVNFKLDIPTIYSIEVNYPEWFLSFFSEIENTSVPAYLYTSNKKVIASYLTGLFQADGWKSKNGVIGITSISEQLILGVSNLMTMLGISGSVVCNRQVKILKTKHPHWTFIVHPTYNDLFLELVTKTLRFETKSIRTFKETKIRLSRKYKKSLLENLTREKATELGTKSIFRLPNRVSSKTLRNYRNNYRRNFGNVFDLIATGEFLFDEIKSVEHTNETVRMFDVVGTESTWCVYNQILTHNCSEGWYCGSWVENPQENILWAAREGRKYNAGRSCKAMSFNHNFHSKFKSNLYELRKSYKQVKFNNMRLNEMGHDFDQWLMMSYLGQTHFAAPIEGISDRIRNGILNKGLDKEVVDFVFDQLIGQPLSDIKVGVVLTGYEEDADWEDLYEVFRKVSEKAAAYNKKYPMRVKCTGLVHYPGCLTEEALTPIEGKGLIRQSGFRIKDQLPGVANSEIINVAEPLEVECLRVELHDGTVLKGTYNHPLLTNPFGEITDGSYTKFEDLKPGQTVYKRLGTECYGDYKTLSHERPLNGSTQKNTYLEFKLDEEFAELMGWYVGDGSINKSQFKLFYNLEELDVRERHLRILNKLGLNVSGYNGNNDSVEETNVNDICFVELVQKYFGKRFDGKRVPDEILTSPKSVQAAFLAGLWGAAGTVGSYYNSDTGRYKSFCRLKLSNFQVIRDVKVMIMNMGYDAHMSGSTSGRKTKAWTVGVRTFHIGEFLNTVKIPGRKGEFKPLGTIRKEYKDAKLFSRVKVKSVTPCGRQTIYGLTVEDASYITDGIVSHNTPLWFGERVIARKAYHKERFLSNERYQKNVDNNIFVKFNGFIGSTFMEQALIDLGRSLTPWLHRNFVVKNHVCYALNSAIKDKAFDEMKEIVSSDHFWEERHPDHCITPFHRIRLELQGALIASARSLLENIHSHEHKANVRCLYTYEGCKTACGSNDMAKSPHKEFGDVELIDGERVGQVLRELNGCDSCKSNEEKVTKHLQRKIYNHEVSVEDLRAQFLGADFTKYRFVVDRKSGGFKELNPANTAYMSIAALLRNSDTLLDTYWEVYDFSNKRQTEPGMPFNVSGRQIIDVTFKDEVYEELKRVLPLANKELQTCQFRDVHKVDMTDTIKIDDLILYRFETPLSYSNLLLDVVNYRGEIDVMKMDLYERIEDESLTPPVLAPKDGKTVGYFTLPSKYNPLVYLQCFVKHKTVSKMESRQVFNVQSLDVLRESSLTCKCGKFALVSLSNNTVFSCMNCIVKQLLQREMKQA